MEGNSAQDGRATAKLEVATAEQKVATAKQEVATAVDDAAKATAGKNLEFALRHRDSAQSLLESAISIQVLYEKTLQRLLDPQLGNLQKQNFC